MKKEDIKPYADDVYDQVSSWINNCDSKASILLALIGVILSITFTSDYILKGIEDLVKGIFGVLKGIGGGCVCTNVILLMILGISLGYLIGSIKNLLLVLYARLDDSHSEENPSICFYRSISSMSYDEYKKRVVEIDDDTMNDDMLRQVHDCSQICMKKFTFYNESIRYMKVGLVLFAIYILAFIVNKSI